MYTKKLPNLSVMQDRFLHVIGKRIEEVTLEAVTFPQLWESTALGFGQIGGAAMTNAYTTIIQEVQENIYGVFFDGKLAYVIDNPNYIFFQDFRNKNMAPIWEKEKYMRGV